VYTIVCMFVHSVSLEYLKSFYLHPLTSLAFESNFKGEKLRNTPDDKHMRTKRDTVTAFALHFLDNTARRKRKYGTNRNCNYPTLTISSSGVGGIFNPPRGRGAVATSLTSSGLETRMICFGDIHTYTLSIVWDAPPLR